MAGFAGDDIERPNQRRFMLLVAGGAPRSERARARLRKALLESLGNAEWADEIDLLEQPLKAVEYGVFATPALIAQSQSGETDVLYGDLNDDTKLASFIAEHAVTRDKAGRRSAVSLN